MIHTHECARRRFCTSFSLTLSQHHHHARVCNSDSSAAHIIHTYIHTFWIACAVAMAYTHTHTRTYTHVVNALHTHSSTHSHLQNHMRTPTQCSWTTPSRRCHALSSFLPKRWRALRKRAIWRACTRPRLCACSSGTIRLSLCWSHWCGHSIVCLCVVVAFVYFPNPWGAENVHKLSSRFLVTVNAYNSEGIRLPCHVEAAASCECLEALVA
jgi:hypothetical protein